MRITVLYDNHSYREDCQSGWGFSCVVDDRILFDTGEAPNSLFYNMDRLKVDLYRIDAVVISHDHWDHTGGLWELLKRRAGLKVYICPTFSDVFKQRVSALKGTLIESDEFREIDECYSVTGEIPGHYKGENMPEQALMVKTDEGMSVITGCSHPGIMTMIDKAKGNFPNIPMTMVMGGFHLMDQDQSFVESIAASIKASGVLKIGPTHCTGKNARKIFKKHFGENYIPVGAGMQLDL
jgi:7,8-dihydropterin-6-yl-methyl-4-(beta-D-ribofuranosyl)aminobenzene 5'-phosphate synthase